jgi:tetratricopeptide (TPR) repeat protein
LAENPEGAYTPAALYYSADCLSEAGDKEGAVAQLNRLTAMYYNSYTQRGYEKMASVAAQSSNHSAAAVAYKQLSTMGSTPAKRKEALKGYMDAVVAEGVADSVVVAADFVVASEDSTPQLVREAEFAKAKALLSVGKRNPAVAIFSRLSREVTSPEGAESAYIIIETAFQYGSFEKAEELVYEFADKNSPQQMWLARSFLLLGDIYVARDNLLQARATYQSIVDGYTSHDDGIVAAAKERVEALLEKAEESTTK